MKKLLFLISTYCFALEPFMKVRIDWPMYKHEPKRLSYNFLELWSIPVRLKYIKNLVPGLNYTSPIVTKGKVFIGTLDGKLNVYTMPTGKLKYISKTNGSIYSTPLVRDGIIYVASTDGKIYSIDIKTGQILWKFQTESGIYSSPLRKKDSLYFASNDGKIYCLDLNLKNIKWTFDTKSYIWSSPAIDSNTLYIGAYNSVFYAIDVETGQLKWKYTTTGPIRATPAIFGNAVYITSTDKKIYAINKDVGTIKWTYQTEKPIFSSPAVDETAVYVCSYDNKVYALELKTGQLKWTYNSGSSIYSTPALTKKFLCIATLDNKIIFLDPKNGKTQQIIDTSSSIKSSPAIAFHRVFILNDAGSFYAYRLTPPWMAKKISIPKFHVKQTSLKDLTISWKPPEGLSNNSEYWIYYSTNVESIWEDEPINLEIFQDFIIKDLSQGLTYYFGISIIDEENEETYLSNVISYYIQPQGQEIQASPEFKLRKAYVYPNPAKETNPVIHIECGIADKVEIQIFNIAAELVHKTEIDGNKWEIIDGEYSYEYEWDVSNIPSGVYIYYIKATKFGEKDISVTKKLAIIK